MVVKGVVVESPDARKLVEAVHFRSVIVFMEKALEKDKSICDCIYSFSA